MGFPGLAGRAASPGTARGRAMRTTAASVALLGLAACCVLGAGGGTDVPKGPCGSAPPASPHRRKAAEAFPPLPLPATPLRRTEKKRPPAPPPLVAKMRYGRPSKLERDGKTLVYYDWDKDPGDVAGLLNAANAALGVRYSHKEVALAALEPDPVTYPIVYFTGSDDFTLTDEQVATLREFVQRGGTVWGDTCFGDPNFFEAFTRELGRALPGRQWRPLPPDHPIFHCCHTITEVGYTRDIPGARERRGPPVFFGLDHGDRTAVILSRYDVSCGWDGHIREGAYSVHPADARNLGVNMVAYALATFPLARYQSTARIYYEDGERARGDFVFAQARLTDNWDTQPNAVANLLKEVAATTSIEVKFQRRGVDLTPAQLDDCPFLYLTGRHEFRLTDAQVLALRSHLADGGFILASPSCGSREFDTAFRREMARVVPDRPLGRLPGGHPVYSILNAIQQVSYTDYVASVGESPPALPLEGMDIGGVTAVIYSPYGLGGGWRGFDHPFGRDVAHEDALQLGVNVVLYATTH
jgi:hypothetical protein